VLFEYVLYRIDVLAKLITFLGNFQNSAYSHHTLLPD